MRPLRSLLERNGSGNPSPGDSLAGLRILCMPSGIGYAHLGRTLLVAAALRGMGCEVAFAYGGGFPETITAEGYALSSVTEIELPSPPDFSGPIMERYTSTLSVRCVESELAAIRQFSPHAVLSDLRPTAAISSTLARLPHIALLNAYLHPDFDLPALYPDNNRSAKHSSRIKKARSLAVEVNRAISYQASEGLRGASSRFGVPARSGLKEYLTGGLNLLVDLPALAPISTTNSQSIYTGPIFWEPTPDQTALPVLPPLPTGFRRIYVSAGHTGQAAMLDRVVSELGCLPAVQVIISTGPYLDPARWHHPPLTWAYRALQGSEVLSGCMLAIHTGASGVTHQCLAHGVPAIAIPSNSDQLINTRLAARLGVLIGLDLSRTPSGAVAELARQMIDHKVVLPALSTLQKSFDPAHGPRAAARTIAERIFPERASTAGSTYPEPRLPRQDGHRPAREEFRWQV